jgi:diguanylate cyclase (GGDEF)-like protein
MTKALDHVADMTRSRDRSMIDITLVGAFLDLLPVRRAVVWRMMGEPGGEQHWQRCVAQSQGDLVAEIDHALGAAEPVDARAMPLHTQAFREVKAVQEPLQDGLHGFRIVLPMASEREVEGVVELLGDQTLTPELQRVALAVLRIHRNFSSLLDYSERDTLTGLLNRKSFDETFLKATVPERMRPAVDDERRLSQPRRHWLGVIDVDRFKLVNDRFGHLIGDEVLVLVARIMRNTFRYHDRLYRFGGEEFLVLLTASDEAHATAAFERMRLNMAQYAFPRAGQVTVSVGFTDVRAGDTPQAAFERADRAVYYAKEHGRNQVHCHAALVAEGALKLDEDNVGDVELF